MFGLQIDVSSKLANEHSLDCARILRKEGFFPSDITDLPLYRNSLLRGEGEQREAGLKGGNRERARSRKNLQQSPPTEHLHRHTCSCLLMLLLLSWAVGGFSFYSICFCINFLSSLSLKVLSNIVHPPRCLPSYTNSPATINGGI